MTKGFQDTSRAQQFKGFPNLNFQMNNVAYGFSGCKFWLDSTYGLDTQTNLGAISKWKDRIMGLEFVQATAANQPRFISSDANFNNRPTVQFQSNLRFLSTVSGGIQVSNNLTVALVVKKDTDNGGASENMVLNFNTDTRSSGIGKIQMSSTSSSVQKGIGTAEGSTIILDSTVIDTAMHLVIIQSGSNGAIMVDGVDYVTNTTWNPGETWTNIGGTGVSTTGLNGTLAEIICYAGLPNTNTARKALSDNINTVYAKY